MKISCSGICDIGLKRKKNQDSIYMYSGKEIGLFVVADGMGGHAMGEIASSIITNRLKEWTGVFSEDTYGKTFSRMMKSLENKIEEINKEIYMKFSQKQICGSTCVLLFIYGKNYGIINVGDSRIYKKVGWSMESLMRDDVWENQIDVKERFTKEEIRNHVNYGKLLRAVGIKENISLSSKTNLLKKGDMFLLCSDGGYKFCSEKEMAKIVRGISENNLEEVVKKIVERCYVMGAKDNISVVVVKCS